MKPLVLSTFCILLCIISISCQKKPSVQAPIALQKEPVKVDFQAPADSIVSTARMLCWLHCNPYLDSLSMLYRDSFATNDASRQIRYQDDFIKAQDKICVRLGLFGGYTEYLWVLNSLGNIRNKQLLDSLKLNVYK